MTAASKERRLRIAETIEIGVPPARMRRALAEPASAVR